MEKGDNFLPLGSVVLLKGGQKKVMITGYCIKTVKDETTWDYSGCLYPEGVIYSNQMALFNHSQITDVFYKGYESDEERDFISKVNKSIGVPGNLKTVLPNVPKAKTPNHEETSLPSDSIPKINDPHVDIPVKSDIKVDLPNVDTTTHVDIPRV